MNLRRICLLGLAVAMGAIPLAGCKGGEEAGVDKPLMTNAPPPPPRPKKPEVSPSGAGPAAPTGASAPP